MTDTEITIALAGLEGWTLLWARPCGPTIGEGEVVGKTPDGRVNVPVKAYLHDANAVLPLLEKFSHVRASAFSGGWIVTIDEPRHSAGALTFCRAACEAILRAHGLWREAQAEEGMG